MKKLFGFASVFALAAGFSLSSCSSDEVAESAPDVEGNGEAIKTQFAISVPGGVKSSRMSQEETQTETSSPVFKGMNDIHVFTFKGAKGNADVSTPGQVIRGTFEPKAIEQDGFVHETKAKIYNDIQIDLGVDRLLFYAKSANTGVSDAIGKLNEPTWSNWKNNAKVDFIEFSPVKKYVETTLAEEPQQGTKIFSFLNALYSNLTSADFVKVADNGESEETTTTTVKWEEATNKDLVQLGAEFKKLNNGSAINVKLAASDLYTRLKSLQGSIVYVKDMTLGNIEDNKKVATDKNIVSGLLAVLDENFTSNGPSAESGKEGYYTLSWKNGVSNFPENIGLPIGVAMLKWNSTAFEYIETDGRNHGAGKTSTLAKEIVYPAALYYYANSTIAVSDKEVLKNAGSAMADWNNFVSEKYGVNNGVINMNTRSVSMIDEVNYGVGQLRTSVKVSENPVLDSKPKTITIDHPFQVTGILIGNQKTVDWKFEQKKSSDAYTVYDNKIIAGIKAGRSVFSEVNPTLVLESAPKEDVYIAVEFLNENEDFKGADGIVKSGSKFYLVAPLKLTDEQKGQNKKVFEKDFYTSAKLTITSLANAYVNVPDLRAPEMEFGLSVDLEWKQGLEFTQDFE